VGNDQSNRRSSIKSKLTSETPPPFNTKKSKKRSFDEINELNGFIPNTAVRAIKVETAVRAIKVEV
jgi:hypothetical protein